MKQFINTIFLIFVIPGVTLLIAAPPVFAQSAPDLSGTILNTKHNLSVSGPGAIKSTTEDRVCIFCHTPHNAVADVGYLWNRATPPDHYTPYQSSTLFATVGQPTGSSKMCLSCHDGTIALGALVSEWAEIPFAGGIRFIPEGPSKLGTDLSDDHPVSFSYNNALAANNNEIVFPSALPPEIKLDSNEQMQCTSCHDPHSNIYGQFLVLPNDFSNLCISCHSKTGWALSSHSLSNATWNNLGTDPWPHTSYLTVAENGCESCHKPHTAGRHERLLNFSFEEDNCLSCHNGNVASSDIEAELSKIYNHPVQNYTGVHDTAEDFTQTVSNHVECADCHNPHVANSNPSPGAPQVSGSSEGVTGINTAGVQIDGAANLFEICYKCHADNNVKSSYSIDRQIDQLNTDLEFDPANPSYHPVESVGINPNVPSLLSPYTTSSIIYCTDCHNSDNSSGPAGPHGSNNKYLLEENYTTSDFTQYSSSAYALCFKCHDENSILGDDSFKEHNKHIVEEDTPCSACHDAHGISAQQGNSINNSHLINFDLSIVEPHPNDGGPYFEDQGMFSGSCTLVCHGKDHEQEDY